MNGWQTNGQPATGGWRDGSADPDRRRPYSPARGGVLITRALATPVAAPLLGMPAARRSRSGSSSVVSGPTVVGPLLNFALPTERPQRGGRRLRHSPRGHGTHRSDFMGLALAKQRGSDIRGPLPIFRNLRTAHYRLIGLSASLFPYTPMPQASGTTVSLRPAPVARATDGRVPRQGSGAALASPAAGDAARGGLLSRLARLRGASRR